MQHPPIFAGAKRMSHRYRPPKFNFDNPSVSPPPPSPEAKQIALRCKSEVENDIDTKFCEYIVHSSTTSQPTPNSGSTSGTDYFIQVIVNTRVTTAHFTGEAKYMQLTVYVDKTLLPQIKEIHFSPPS